VASEQNFPQFLAPSWFGVKCSKKIEQMYWILADFEPWNLLLDLTRFDSENVFLKAFVLRLFS